MIAKELHPVQSFNSPFPDEEGVESPVGISEASPLVGNRGSRATRIMIVDDDLTLIRVVRKYLRDVGYDGVFGATDANEAIGLIEQQPPDVILLDVMMPGYSGLDVLRRLRRDKRLKHVPILILTASNDAAIKMKALELGVTDFLLKPVDASELVTRVRNALVVKVYQDHLERHAEQLEEKVRKRTAELAESRQEIILCLARAAEFRDNDTGHHIVRVGRYAGIIARALDFSDDDVATLELAAQMHDVGKIGVPDAILKKPERLDPEEFEVIKKHCDYGRSIFERMPEVDRDLLRNHTEVGAKIMDSRTSRLMRMAARIAYTHHEKWDGTGYPSGLAGTDIPIEGRITAVADVFDALSTKRPYKPAIPLERCFEIMAQSRGTHFDPKVIDAFFARRAEILRVQTDLSDN